MQDFVHQQYLRMLGVWAVGLRQEALALAEAEVLVPKSSTAKRRALRFCRSSAVTRGVSALDCHHLLVCRLLCSALIKFAGPTKSRFW